MIAIALAFFIASFAAASLASERMVSGSELPAGAANCMTVVTGEKTLIDCSTP